MTTDNGIQLEQQRETYVGPGPVIQKGNSPNDELAQAVLTTPVPSVNVPTIETLMASPEYWDAAHPKHAQVKAQVRQAFEAQAAAKAAATAAPAKPHIGMTPSAPAPAPVAAPAPAPAPANPFVSVTPSGDPYDPALVLNHFGVNNVDHASAKEFADFAKGQGLTPEQYRSMVVFSQRHAVKLGDMGEHYTNENAMKVLAKTWGVQPSQVTSHPKFQASHELVKQFMTDDQIRAARGLNDPIVIALLGEIASRR